MLAAEAGRVMLIEPGAELPVKAGLRLVHTTLMELVVPPVVMNAPLRDEVKLNWPVRAGAEPPGVTTTPKVNPSTLTPLPSDRLMLHEMLPPEPAVLGQLMLMEF